MVKALKTVNIQYKRRVADGVPLRPNLLNGTSFGRGLAAWSVKAGKPIAHGGVPSRAFQMEGRDAASPYAVGLEQPLAPILQPDTLYAISFDAAPAEAVECVVYVGESQASGEVGATAGRATWYHEAHLSAVIIRPDEQGRAEVWFRTPRGVQSLRRIEFRNLGTAPVDIYRPKLEQLDPSDLRPSLWCLSESDKLSRALIVPLGEWDKLPDGTPLLSGNEEEGETILHTVYRRLEGGGEAHFLCRRSHTKSPAHQPTAGSPLWEMAAGFEYLYAAVFEAVKARVEQLIVGRLSTRQGGEGEGITIGAQGQYNGLAIYGQAPGATFPGITSYIDRQGNPRLAFHNIYTGQLLYDLGPETILQQAASQPTHYTSVSYRRLEDGHLPLLQPAAESETLTAHFFEQGWQRVGALKKWDSKMTEGGAIFTDTDPSPLRQRWLNDTHPSLGVIPDGWLTANTTAHYHAYSPPDIRVDAQPSAPSVSFFEASHFLEGRIAHTCHVLISTTTGIVRLLRPDLSTYPGTLSQYLEEYKARAGKPLLDW